MYIQEPSFIAARLSLGASPMPPGRLEGELSSLRTIIITNQPTNLVGNEDESFSGEVDNMALAAKSVVVVVVVLIYVL